MSIHEYVWPLLAFSLFIAILYNVDNLKRLRIRTVFYETTKEIGPFRSDAQVVLKEINKFDELKQTIELITGQILDKSIIAPPIEDINIKVQEAVNIGEAIKANVLRMESSVNKVEVLVDKAEKELSGKISAKSNFRGNLDVIKKKNDKKKSINSMRYYFAYGSNMDKEELDRWCKKKGKPKIEFLSVSPAKLNGYKLSFNYFSSSWEAGAANIMKSDEDCIYGLLIELEEESIKIIREKEGYENYYDEINVEVEKFDGIIVLGVKTYKALKEKEKPTYQPSTKYYLSLLIKNAEKYSFPNEYIEFLKSLETKD